LTGSTCARRNDTRPVAHIGAHPDPDADTYPHAVTNPDSGADTHTDPDAEAGTGADSYAGRRRDPGSVSRTGPVSEHA
jgi:hypothetical protein